MEVAGDEEQRTAHSESDCGEELLDGTSQLAGSSGNSSPSASAQESVGTDL